MPLKVEAIREMRDAGERAAAAEELLAFALRRAGEARQVRDQAIREMRASGEGVAAIARRTGTNANTVKALTRGAPAGQAAPPG